MRNLSWLGIATLVMMFGGRAEAGEPLKPFVVLVLDTSGSMDTPTGFGPPSCGGLDQRIDHATCAINRIVNSYGDMVFALGRFRETTSGPDTVTTSCDLNNNNNGNPGGTAPIPSGGDECGVQGVFCGDCDESVGLGDTCSDDGDCASGDCSGNPARCQGFGTCTTADREFELLTPLVDGNNQLAVAWTDGSCSRCTTPTPGTSPTSANEIWGVSPSTFTPLAAVLSGAKLYWLGQVLASDGTTVIWPSNAAGFAPIANDTPVNLSFLPQPGKPATCNPNPATCDSNSNCTSATNCCCLEQCRPLITILLTDGAETCTTFSNTTAAAASLLATDVNNRRYRVETKPIGFGITPGNAQIEGIAHAGGAFNVTTPVDLNEGFYAQNEAELQLAISAILDDAIKTETCNNIDDDCDGQADEDFEPAKGEICENGAIGQCRTTGTLVCKADGTGLTCNAVARTCVNNQLFIGGVGQGPNTCDEECNTLDDDCDGKIDEGLANCTCSPQQEQCNGKDDDCDTRIDEASTNGPLITRPCGTGTCQGVETCRFVQNCGPLPGTPGCSGFGDCTADDPEPEICDGLDNDCNGIRDGFQQGCSTMDPVNDPFDSPTNNPGHPDNNPIAQNICTPGFKVCVANPPTPGNSFGACNGEIKPCNDPNNNTAGSCADLCNGRDDDCDNQIDEDFAPANCDTDCGVGTTQCVAGVLSCNAVQASDDDSCDGNDDDCDFKFDEDFECTDQTPKPGFPATCNPKTFSCDPSPTCTDPTNCCCACSCTGSGVCNASESCIGGSVVCQGEPISQESCDCLDNDCDGSEDEGNLCGAGSICNQFCQCAFQCSAGEFPCPLGKFCKQETEACSTAAGCDASDACTQDPLRTDCCCRSLCIADPCFGISCPPVNGNKQVCQVNAEGNQGTCVDACAVANCAPLVCIPDTGECKPDDCTTFPDRCSDNQNCIAGVCVTNLCKDVQCPTDQYCVLGNCVASCADVECPSGQRCKLGVCEDDPCDAPCPFGEACNDNTGECVSNGCGNLNCPQGQWCNPNNDGGTCEDDPCVGTACPSDDQVCLGGTCYDPDDFAPDGGVEVRVTAGGGGCSTGGGTAGCLIGLALLFLARRRGGRS